MLFQASNLLNVLGAATQQQADNALNPLYDAISTIGPYALAILCGLLLIYSVIIGVRFAKAEDAKDRANIQKILINGIIGFVTIIILISILYAIREPLSEWMSS